MTNEIVIIRRVLMQAKGDAYLSTIKEYCSTPNTYRYHKGDFFDAFCSDEELCKALKSLDKKCNFTTYCQQLVDLVGDVVEKKILNPSTTYHELATLSRYKSASQLYYYIEEYADLDNSKKLCFTYFYNELHNAYIKKSRKVSKNRRGKIRNRYNELASSPQPYILELLTYSGLVPASIVIAPELIQNSLIRSFK